MPQITAKVSFGHKKLVLHLLQYQESLIKVMFQVDQHISCNREAGH